MVVTLVVGWSYVMLVAVDLIELRSFIIMNMRYKNMFINFLIRIIIWP